jgi:hypothetical protein
MITGLDSEPLDHDQTAALLDWVTMVTPDTGRPLWLADCLSEADGSVYLLCHCDDGVTWGHSGASGSLSLSSDERADWRTPSPTVGALQQLRLFGPEGEIRLWRTVAGRAQSADDFSGRMLTETAPVGDENAGEDGPLRPERLVALVAGRPQGEPTDNGFLLHVLDGGYGHLPPVPEGVGPAPRRRLGIEIRRYFEQLENGAVRMAAARLVEPVWTSASSLQERTEE